MWVRKDKAGACSGPDGGYTWENDGDVIEVADHIGEELVGMPGFAEAEPPKGAAAAKSGDDGDGDQPKRRGGRPRKAVAEAPTEDADKPAEGAESGTPDAAQE